MFFIILHSQVLLVAFLHTGHIHDQPKVYRVYRETLEQEGTVVDEYILQRK